MKITLFFFSLLFVTNALSQKVEVEFGRVSPEEMEMTIYEKDKEAKAVILYDKGESIFFDTPKGGYDIRFTRHKRIKIFDKSESQPAEISIPFYVDGFGKTEKVVSIEAFTFNTENGRIFRKTLDPSTIYEERINKRWLRKKFVFPDVQDGSILELKYVLETPFHFNLPDWKFQDKIPTIYSEYEVRMIPFYEYVFLLQGVTKFDYRNSFVTKEKRYWGRGVEFQEYVHVYGLKDIPAFKDESYITSINDHIVKLDFQLAKFNSPRGGNREIISTWPALNQALLKHERFGKYLKNSERLAEKILEEELDLLALKPDKKVSKIIDYVKNSFEWNGSYSKYGSQSPKDFLNKKSGSVADINLFLTAMLNAAGINAQPVILSTRNHGKIYTDYPFDHYTNYVITLVSSSSPFLADATEDFLPFNRLPPRCLNGKGLIVNSDEEVSWVNLGSSIPSSNKKLITLTIDSLSLNVDAKVLVQSTEYESYYSRKKFSDDKTKLEAFYSDKIGNISETKTSGYTKVSMPYSVQFKSTYETEKLGDNIVIKPFLDLPLSKNYLTKKTRSYPIDFIFATNEEFEASLGIPKGFSISTLPESIELFDELVEISLNYSLTKDALSVVGNYKFKKAIYVPGAYGKLKEHIDQIVQHFNQPILLEKKNW